MKKYSYKHKLLYKLLLCFILTVVAADLVASIGLYTAITSPIPNPGPTPKKLADVTLESKSVMITNLQSNSGGSGVILASKPNGSYILTNKHVCGVVENGGLVHTEDGSSVVVESYKEYTSHDLCVILVLKDLHENTTVASLDPSKYDESVTIGHPSLLPTIVSKGMFSDQQQVTVMTGYRDCTAEEAPSAICTIVGKMPVIRNYTALVSSGLIMPGSSGSPVFNSDGELEALVFAGQGDIGYAFAVPHQYIVNFLANLSSFPVKYPNMIVNLIKREEETKASLNRKFDNYCESSEEGIQDKVCSVVNNYLVYNKRK